jgi:hypothetical protein
MAIECRLPQDADYQAFLPDGEAERFLFKEEVRGAACHSGFPAPAGVAAGGRGAERQA